ncbi:MAG: GNAT family N-acetyltransferase [Chloroflexi bacterium]|nr:GNAT family N-acetyltransferase [Chloroflexota bacterium]
MSILHELAPEDLVRARPLFTPLAHHLAIESILAGLTPGRVFVDDARRPKTAVAWFKRRLFLTGDRSRAAVNRALADLLTDVYYPAMLASGLGNGAFTLVFTPGWERVMDVVLAGKEPLTGRRLCFRLDPARHAWEPALPPGFTLRPVDADLLADPTVVNREYVAEEMVSERPSAADFLAQSFGVCVLDGPRIVGWCMSEYNTGGRCELGIETADAYQRRGLARATATAVIREAVRRGYTEIGWICDADNQPSIAAAQKLGFQLWHEDPTYYAFFDPVINYGVHGNGRFRQGQYHQAVVWYEKALSLGDGPVWLFWNAACAYAHVGNQTQVFANLNRAVAAGFADRAALEQSEHFRPLHDRPQWTALLARLT